MKVLLTGGKGMLGRTLVRELADGFDVILTDLPGADITDRGSLDAVFAKHAPDAVIHCAAMTAVDRCETERDLAFRLNESGSANVAEICNRRGIRLIAVSTDYVFDGDADCPYRESDRATGGHTVYGQSRVRHVRLRTAIGIFQLSQSENRHFSLLLRGSADFHA